MLENYGRILVWILVAAFVAPSLMSMVVLMRTTAAVNSAFQHIDDVESIATSMSKSEVTRRTRQLKKLLAPQNAISGVASRLTIAAVTFEGLNQDRLEAAKAASGSGGVDIAAALAAPHDVAVDYGDATRRAVVLISNDTLALDVSATNPSSAVGVLGVESKLFPDTSKLKPGMLAGFKVEAAGARTASPVDLSEAEYDARGSVCKSIRSWSRHFGVTLDNVDYVVFRDPAKLSFDGSKWVSDGREIVRLYDTDIAAACE